MAKQEFESFTGKLDAPTEFEPFDGTLDGEPPKPAGALRDLGKSLKVGVQKLPGMVTGLADLPIALATGARPFTSAADAVGEATGFQPGKWADETQRSDDYKAGQANVNKAWAGVDAVQKDESASKLDYAKKLLADAPEIAGEYLKNPMYTANQVVESVPGMIAGGAASKLAKGLGALAGKGISAEAAAAGAMGPVRNAVPGYVERVVGDKWVNPVVAGMGEGAVTAGSAMDSSKGEDQQKNAIAALGAGVGTGLIGIGAGRLSNKLGLETSGTAMAKLGDGTLGNGLGATKRILGGAISEAAFQELPQSMQEAMWQNYADGKPIMQGVARQGIEGALAGAVMGGGANVFNSDKQATPPPEQPPAAVPPLQLGNTPDPYLSFPDGTVARQSEIDAYINGLPVDQQPAARAKVMGLSPQPVVPEQPPVTEPKALGYNPLAGTPTIHPDGTVTLNGEQEFQRRTQSQPATPADPIAEAAAQGGAISRAVLANRESIQAHQDQQTSEADQADYDAHMAQKEAEAQQQNTATQPITHGKLAEAKMPPADLEATVYPPPDVLAAYVGTHIEDIFNGEYAPFSSEEAAQRRAKMEGALWAVVPVFDGWVVRKKDANVSDTRGIQPLPSTSSGQDGNKPKASVGLGTTDGNGVGADAGGLEASSVGEPRQLPSEVPATPVARGNTQPTTLDVLRVKNTAPAAIEPTAPAEAPASAVGKNPGNLRPEDVASPSSGWIDSDKKDGVLLDLIRGLEQGKTYQELGIDFGADDHELTIMQHGKTVDWLGGSFSDKAMRTAQMNPDALRNNLRQRLSPASKKALQSSVKKVTAAKDVQGVKNPAPAASDTKTEATPVEAPQAVAGDAATAGKLPGAGSAPVESAGIAPVTQSAPNEPPAFTRKLIPGMTDAELQQAVDYFGPDHKRTPKLIAAIEKRNFAKKSAVLQAINPIPQDASAANRAKLKAKNKLVPKDRNEADAAIQDGNATRELGAFLKSEKDAVSHAEAVSKWRTQYFGNHAETIASGDISRSDYEKLSDLVARGSVSAQRATEMIDSAADAGVIDKRVAENIKNKIKPVTAATTNQPQPQEKPSVTTPTQAQQTAQEGQAQPPATAGIDNKAKWIKAVADKNRLNGDTGVQLTVTSNGKLSFLGDPNSSKDGRALQANLNEALKAGATVAEIAAALKQKPAAKPSLKQRMEDERKARSDYFTPGNIVQSYGGHDEVISYTPPKEDGSGWSVKVHAVENVNGEWVRIGKPQDTRTHSTHPEARAMKAGPIDKVSASDVGEANYTEVRADGQAFPNVPARPQKPEIVVDKAEMRPYRKPDGSVGYEAVPIVEDTQEAEKPGTVNVPPTVAEAFTAQMQKQKGRITRLKNEAVKAASLDDKKAAQLKVTAAEATLRQMRLKIFDAEDAAIKAVEAGDTKAFSEYADLFPGAAEEIAKLTGQNDELDAEMRSYEAKKNPTYSGEPKTPQAPANTAQPATESVAKPDAKSALSEREKAAKAKMLNAVAKLAHMAGKNTRMNWTQEEKQQLLPIVIDLFDGAMELGAVSFQKAVAYVRDFISSNIDQETADSIPFKTLKGAYIAATDGRTDAGITSDSDVAQFTSLAELENSADKADTSAKPSLNGPEGRHAIAQSVADHFIGGGKFDTIIQARKFISELTGEKIESSSKNAKLADETIEMGVVLAGREMVKAGRNQKRSDQTIYDRLVSLYNAQPNLSVRSSTSVEQQAYSTPIPLAFVASRLAKIKKGDIVAEPTAGNSALVLEVLPAHTVINELNDDRIGNLKAMGFTPTQKNAATEQLAAPKSVDAAVMNPPFGAVKDGEGKTIYFDVPAGPNTPALNTREIDHAIVFNSLATIKDDGRAVLIVGGVDASSEDQIREGYRGKGKREFYYKLYNEYKVTDHFTVDGGLYSRQGAGYPVDVIVIDGRGKSARDLPAANLPQRIMSYDQLKEKLNEANSLVPAGSGTGVRVGSDPARVSHGTDVATSSIGSPDVPGIEGVKPGASIQAGSKGDGVRPILGQSAGSGSVSGGGKLGATGTPTQPDGPARGGLVAPAGVSGESGRKAGNGGNRSDDVGGNSSLDGKLVGSGLTDRRGQEAETENQVGYTPKSGKASVGTLVPVNMRDAIQESLSKVADDVGDLDDYVAKALGYTSKELGDYLSAEQIDALALAIYNAEQGKGFIIGDQTGIGKGRVNAAMIRYAIKKGQVPIFITEKPNLYADMIRDLDDIGMAKDLDLEGGKPHILMTNNGESIPYELYRNVNGEVVEHKLTLKAPKSNAKDAAALLAELAGNGELGRYKVIFSTYSQLQSIAGKATERQRFLTAFAKDNFIIFDESHNAGGTGEAQDSRAITKVMKAAGMTVPGRAGFARNLVKLAKGTFFSSATYAKRPDVMDLYSSTNMSLAVDKPADLATAIKAGGVPLQQAVATMLTADGQYIRRERTFAGVSYETQLMPIDRQTGENMAESMRWILAFSRAKEALLAQMQKEFDKEGAIAQNVGGEKTQVAGANFGSVMHNLIDQMLLALKVEESVKLAIAKLKAGEKVVLTVSNTMGSFLKDYADEMGIRPGDAVSLSFKDLYLRYLDKQRKYRVKSPGGQVKEKYLTDAELGHLLPMHNKIQAFIQNAGFGSAPISPIDYMHNELRKAGYKTDEITGRTATVDYEGGIAKLASRTANIKQRLKAIGDFNSGAADVLILNQSGSTGLSLHASAKFKDQKKRHMIIVQAEKNIDTHMQMLGRVHRTGQVVTPGYTQAMADTPAEMRPAAVLSKKMAGLSANTTASRKSAVAAEGVVDFINEYGGQVAAEFLQDNPEVHDALGGQKRIEVPSDLNEAGEELIRKLTGYIPILPLKQQEQIYADLIERYNDLIARENSMGTNRLETKALDLDAKTLTSEKITANKGSATETSVFAEPANMEQVDVKRNVKPLTPQELEAAINETLNGVTPQQYNTSIAKEFDTDLAKYVADVLEKMAVTTDNHALVQGQKKDQLFLMGQNIKRILSIYKVGDSVTITDKNASVVHGVITGITHNQKTKNPAAGSAWKMTFALANGDARTMSVGFGQLGQQFSVNVTPGTVPQVTADGKVDRVMIRSLFENGNNIRREKRWMVTGNLLAGFSKYQGQIVSYTKADGGTGQGVLMNRQFDYKKEKGASTLSFSTSAQAIEFLTKAGRNAVLGSPDRVLRIVSLGGDRYSVMVPSSKREGGSLYLDRGLLDAFGSDFYKQGQNMSMRIDGNDTLERGLNYLIAERDDVSLAALTNQDVARKVLGMDDAPKAVFSQGLNAPKSLGPKPTADQIQRLVDKVLQVAKNVVPVSIIGNPSQIHGVNVPAGSKPTGAVIGGRVYLFSDNISSMGDAYVTLFHELFHLGLQKVIPAEDYATLLRQFSRNLLVQKFIREWKASPEGVEKAQTMNSAAYDALAAEEALAMVSEELSVNNGIGTNRTPGLVKAMLSWIAEVVDKMGFPAVFGKWMRGLTQTDAERFVSQMVSAALGGQKSLASAQAKYGTTLAQMTKQTRLSAGKTTDQTDTDAFRKWFGDSKVVDADGKPLVVYHGTEGEVNVFEPYWKQLERDARPHELQGNGSIAQLYKAAKQDPEMHFFAAERGTAESYGQDVVKAYLKIENMVGSATMARDEALKLMLDSDADGAMFHDTTSSGRYGGVAYVIRKSNQAKSATSNNGQFDGTNPDIRFRSGGIGETLASAANSARDVNLPAGYKVGDLFNSVPGKLNWWYKTVGTQYHLAQKSPAFKRVYDAVQTFINDVSYFATEAADLAPNILPKLESWKDIAKSPLSAADTKALSAPVFEGTLSWARDESGKPVKMEVLEEAAAKLTTEQKAQRLLRGDHISQNVLKMWQGLPIDQFEKLIEGKYERDMLKAGIVFTPAELKALFNLNDKQVSLYQEFRKAIDKSLTNLAVADMIRFGGKDVDPIREQVLESKTVGEAAEMLRDYLLSVADDNEVLIDTANKMIDKGDKAQGLMDRGYAPLSRFGTYTLDVVDANGERAYFGMFESAAEASKMRRKMEGLYPGSSITQGTVSEEAYKMFAGVSPETLELFGDMLGLESQGDSAASQAFQEYLKLAKSSRSAMKRLIQRKGIAGFSEDAGRVLAGFVYSNARQTASGLHMGEMTNAANDISQTQGELKDAAVKLVDYIKNPREEAQALRGLLFAQYIGGSVASAMVNMTQPLTMTFPWLSQYGGVASAAKQMTAAMKDQGKKLTGDSKLDAALRRAEEDGTVSPQEVHSLMQQSQGRGALQSGDGTRAGDALAKANNALSKIGLAWGKLFGVAEQFNRRVTFIAAYRTAVAQGMANPDAFARKAIAETQGVYNKGNKPAWARGAVGSTLFTFKQYSIAYVEMLTRMAKNGPEGKKAALLALGVLFLMAGAGGMPGADDLDDIISGAMQSIGYNFDSKMKRKEFFVSILGEGGAQFMERGISGLPGVPIDVSGRMGLGNLLPGTGLFTKKADHTRDVVEIVGPAGDFAKRGFEAAGSLITGDVGKAVNAISPKAVQNLAQAYDMANMGMYRDAKGMKVLDTDAVDAAVKAIGFQPNDVKRAQDANFEAKRMIDLNKINESEIANQWAMGIFERDTNKVKDARDRLAEWNEANPESPIRINFRQITQRVQKMNQTKAERIAKTAPAEIRNSVRQELATQ